MLINKFLTMGLLKLNGSQLPSTLEYLKDREYQSLESNIKIQKRLLKRLLIHCYKNVPYYQDVLVESRVIVDDRVDLTKFSNIPVLTKEIIREHFEDLKSRDLNKRKWYLNTSGGSTGEPVKFLQDSVNWDRGMAGKWFFSTFAGKDVGDKEIKLWGSERDILKGSIGFKAKLKNLVFNRLLLNSFKMSEEDMRQYVKIINRNKPVLIEAYIQSIYELAKFIKNNGLEVYSPKSILTSAGTLYPEQQKLIEKVFETKVYNRYGSREVGDVACSCGKDEGLHVNVFTHYVEILDDKMKPCKPGEIGQVYVTTLTNYVMPLIRYQIGDMAVPAENEQCSCGRGLPLVKRVVGRQMDVFKTKDGRMIPGEFFIHFIGVVYNKDFISKFQVVQKDYGFVVIRLVLRDEIKFNSYKKKIVDSIKDVMGHDCKVEFEFVDAIEPTKSGKYLYTISEVE